MVGNKLLRQKDTQVLEYDRFLSLLAELTPNERTRKKILSLRYSTDPEEVKKRISLASEFISVLRSEGYFPLTEIPDITQTLDLLSIEESVLSPEELLNTASVLKIAREVKNFLSPYVGNTRYLVQLHRELYPSRETERIIHDSIDSSGMVKDSASRDLASIRKSIREVEKQIISILEGIIYSQKYADIVQEKLITVRRDRYVIPVKYNFAGKLQGIIQDRSSSGQTIYLEPVSVVQLNNRLSDLKLQEHIEIRRILKFLTDILRGKLAGLRRTYSSLIQLDYLYTVGKYALKYNCVFPEISGEMHLIDARHPVFLMLEKEFRPIELKLGQERKGLIITGPNTGGKTVALKTAGLSAMLVQSGIPVPVAEGSKIPVFDGIYADIGDMQSIEHSLSTFSAHILNIKEIVSSISENSLVLLDELIPGTDPDEGSAIGIGILEKIKKTGGYVIATTHFKQIKIYALSDNYFNVASVGFDRERLIPTYTIHYNSVGQSMAFYIAEKLGLDPEILETGKRYVDEHFVRLEEAISRLEKFKAEYEEKIEKAKKLETQLQEEKIRYEALRKELEKEKRQRWEIVRKEAEEYLKSVRDRGYQILQEIKNTGSGKSLEEFITTEKGKLSAPKVEEHQDVPSIEIGDKVKLKGKNTTGEVISIREDRVHVNFNGIKIWTRLSDLEAVSGKKEEDKKVKFSFSRKRDSTFRPELKIIGKTREEAIREVEQFIDRAVTEGISTVRIVHGYGSGILRKAVREYLDSLPFRVKYEDAPYNEGGMGVTIVHLN
ncbi:endonuclease MutS2 [Persephonella sp.]